MPRSPLTDRTNLLRAADRSGGDETTSVRAGMRSRAGRLFMPVFNAACVVAVGIAAIGSLRELDAHAHGATALLLAAPAVALIAQIVALAAAWHVLLGAAVGSPPSTRLSIKSFLSGWLSRYIPGPPSGVAGKFLTCRKAGLDSSVITVSLMTEQLLQLAACIAFPALFAPFGAGPVGFALGGVGMTLAVAVLWASAHPAPLRMVLKALRRAGARAMSERPPLSFRALARSEMLMLLAAILSGVSFHAVAVLVADVPADAWARSLFVFGTASLAGFLVPFLPSGAGAREAVIVAFLAPEIGHIDAISVAVMARGVAVLLDATLAATWFGILAVDQLAVVGRNSRATLAKKRS